MICIINLNTPSITDWIQALGVVFASIGLVINFIYQRKSTDEQTKATLAQVEMAKRDFERYLVEIKPRFKFRMGNSETYNPYLLIDVISQPVFDFLAFNLSENQIELGSGQTPFTYEAGGEIVVSFKILHEVDIFNEYGYDYYLRLEYKDILGNLYSQNISIYNSSTVHFEYPKLQLVGSNIPSVE
jgi:hypothetical protein